MAIRQPKGRAGRSAPRTEPAAADAPLIDQIFPNRAGAEPLDFEPTANQYQALKGIGAVDRVPFRHRKLGRMARRIIRGDEPRPVLVSRLVDQPVRRRRVLLGLGTTAVAASAVGASAAVVSGGLGSVFADDAEREPRKFATATEGLGAVGTAETPAAAARMAAGITPRFPTPLARDPELHLLRRATFGPRLVDHIALKQMGIDAWIDRQLAPEKITDPVSDQVLQLYPTVRMNTAQIRSSVKEGDYLAMWELGHSTLARQVWSSRQLYEVMVDFWANHLNVTNPFDGGWDIRGPYDRDVIRKHALGRFSDMLYASARHPAMLRYLNNDQSSRRSVNENYGREVLELHTVGIEAKYSEVDVRNSAYIMTGRTIDNAGTFEYEARRHWTGRVRVLSFTHENKTAAGGLAAGDAYLTYLATHPATARRIGRKLAMRFVCDDPPPELVDRLAQAYLENNTAIAPVLRLLFRSLEFWLSTGLKTRRPLENLVATARVLDVKPGSDTKDGVDGLYWLANQLGHAPLNWAPPDGFPDVQDAWNSAHATLGTWNGHRAMVQGWHKGLTYVEAHTLVGAKPATVGKYLDTIAQRLLFQPLPKAHRQALLTFLGAKDSTSVKSTSLGGKVDNLVPLILDSVYHALR